MANDPILIVGAGPAGISAASWLASLNQDMEWYSPTFGGMVPRIHNTIRNFPPHIWQNGSALCDELRRFVDESLHHPRPDRVVRVTKTPHGFEVAFSNDDTRSYPAVIVATGTRYRTLGVPGEDEGLRQGWVSQSSNRDATTFAGRPVAVVGGGDAAFESALNLVEHDCKVLLILRSPARARPAFQRRVESNEAIDILPIGSVVTRMERISEGVEIAVESGDAHQTLEVAGVFVRIGVETVVPDIDPKPESSNDRLKVDSGQQTSVPGLYAAGDITTLQPRGIVSAMGQGAIAARNATSLVQRRGSARGRNA